MVVHTICHIVNSRAVGNDPDCADWTLVCFLGEKLSVTITKQSCENKGTCGPCSEIIKGRMKRASLEYVAL